MIHYNLLLAMNFVTGLLVVAVSIVTGIVASNKGPRNGYDLKSVDVISEENEITPTCKKPNLPEGVSFPQMIKFHSKRFGKTGEARILSCGSINNGSKQSTNKCYLLNTNVFSWKPFPDMKANREFFSIDEVWGKSDPKNYTLVAIGGFGSHAENTLEYFDLEIGSEWIKVPMPFRIWGHCSIRISYQEIMVIGGVLNGHVSSETKILNTTSWEWKNGPSLKQKRAHHGCLNSYYGSEESPSKAIYAQGGKSTCNSNGNNSSLYSTEVLILPRQEENPDLDHTSTTPEWSEWKVIPSKAPPFPCIQCLRSFYNFAERVAKD